MADKPVGEVVAVDAVLDALSSPTSSDVYEALDAYSTDAVAAVAAKRAAAGGGSQTVLVARQYLDNDAVKGLPTSGGIELVATPGAGQMLWPIDAVFYCDTNAAAYSGFSTGGELGIEFGTNGPGDFLDYFVDGGVQGDVAALLGYGGLAIAGMSRRIQIDPGNVNEYPYVSAGYDWIDQPLNLASTNSSGPDDFLPQNFGGGDPANFMVVAVRYSILDMTAP